MLRPCFIFLLFTFLCAGCEDDRLDMELPAEVKIQLALHFIHDTPLSMNSRAISQNGADTSGISDLNIFIFDANGNLLQQQYSTGTSSSVSVSTTSGQRNIAVIANAATSLNAVTTLSQLQTLYTQASSASGMMNPSKKLIMTAQTGTITIPPPSTPGGSVTVPTIYLTRLYSKITTTFSYALNPGISITPTKIKLCQVPKSCYYFPSNSPATTAQILARGDSLYRSSGITSTSHANATPLYMYENLQGNNGSNTQQSQKTPATGKSGFCSYLEVTANYSSPTLSGQMVYRYYLGTNTLTNFDVARNTWHQVSITFNGNGGITENSWRVNVTGLYNTALPPTLYFPYYAGRAQIYNFGQTGLSTTIGGLSSSTRSAVIMDSSLFVMSKTGNGSSATTLGTVTVGGNNYTVVMQPTGSSEFFVDVSTLDFPQNTTFGFTNYPITQYVQILNTGGNIGTWTARSTASWLYIGKGNDFPIFSASGTAYTWSTTSPITSGSKMYNSTGGTIQGSSTPAAVAVRCSANTGNSTRTGYILFTGSNNQEVARVFVSQNPQTFPQSPVGLRSVAGGVFQPGAFTSSGATASPQPDGSSTSQVYVGIPQFYMATKECSIQNFAEYLNDLGVTNVSQLSGQASTKLDKTGVIGDYPGTLLTITVWNVFNPSNGGPAYSNSKWGAPTRSIEVNGAETSTVNGWIGNFPMSNVSFYGAYDYGYWMNKKTNVGTPSRATTRGIPTDMQWEAAARGITNNFTTLSAYNGSSSSTKNGLFPYPFPSQSFNSGLTGTESTNNDLLKSISLYSSFGSQATGTIVYGSNTYQLPTGNLIPNMLYIYDLSGNVQEWVLDTYSGQNLGFSLLGLVTAPVNLILSTNRVVRGGNSISQASNCSNVYRSGLDGNTLSNQVGFRAVINTN